MVRQGRRLGQPVDLYELPPELGLHPLNGLRWRRRAGHHDADGAAAGDGTTFPLPVAGGVEDGCDHGGRSAEQGHAVPLDAGEDLLSVHLAQHDVGTPHPGQRVGHAPPVAMEHREGVQQDVAVADPGVPPEGDHVDPAVPLGQLHAFGPRRGARGVVDRAGGILVGLPALGLGPLGRRGQQGGVLGAVEGEAVGHVDAGHHVAQLGVIEEHGCPGVLHDELDLIGRQAEVDGDQDAPVAADAEIGGQELPRIRADDGHPGAMSHVEMVERERQPARPGLQLAIGQLTERSRRARLVDDGDPVGVHQRRPVEKVRHRQCDPHGTPKPSSSRFPRWPTIVDRGPGDPQKCPSTGWGT